ncbi:MAG: hypothetical protein ABSD59_17460 [Terracidiphilus sp.]|jgi:hypothetical protein
MHFSEPPAQGTPILRSWMLLDRKLKSLWSVAGETLLRESRQTVRKQTPTGDEGSDVHQRTYWRQRAADEQLNQAVPGPQQQLAPTV